VRLVEEAWVSIPSSDDLEQLGLRGPYDFGFIPAMGRLIMTHPRIAPAYGALFNEVMFSPESHLDRREREMVAAVASAAQDCFY